MSASAGSTGVYRVTIRGRFTDLTDQARAYLQRHVDEHDIFVSAYTPEGTLTYDKKLDFFNLRYEVRADDADGATERALGEAGSFLSTMGLVHGPLKTTVVDMATMWDESRGRASGA